MYLGLGLMWFGTQGVQILVCPGLRPSWGVGFLALNPPKSQANCGEVAPPYWEMKNNTMLPLCIMLHLPVNPS